MPVFLVHRVNWHVVVSERDGSRRVVQKKPYEINPDPFVSASDILTRRVNISDESRQHCVQLFAELGQKLQQRRRSAEQRVDDVKQMLTYFMRCRGLKRLEGELNTIRPRMNSQASLQIDDWELPRSSVCILEHSASFVERDAGAFAPTPRVFALTTKTWPSFLK